MVHVFNFDPGKYLTLIFLFLDMFFFISPDIVESPKVNLVPSLHSSLFCCTELLSALLIFSAGVDLISFVLICSSEDFTVCSTSFTGQFLVFELREDSCLEGLSITTSKSTPDSLHEKLSTSLLLIQVHQVRELLQRNFFFY